MYTTGLFQTYPAGPNWHESARTESAYSQITFLQFQPEQRLVDFDKADFIGKAALETIRARGVKRQMVGVFMGGDPFEKNNEHRWAVFSATEQVGLVTLAVYSPRLERNIGFALLDVAHGSEGGALRVESAEGVRDITITSLPLVDPDKNIPRASLRKS